MTSTRRISLVFLTVLAIACVALPAFEWLLGHGANDVDLTYRFAPPSATQWLGGDELGRDVFLRLLAGGQVSLLVGLSAAVLSMLVGTLAGIIAGYRGGISDMALMRLCDVLLALPALPLLIILAAIDLQKLGISADMAASPWLGLAKIVVLLGMFGWVTVARLVRARTRTLANMDFVRAAIALGHGDRAIMKRHILPNVMQTVITAGCLAAGVMILAESVLSFLGLGIQPPVSSWGNMLTRAEDNLWQSPLLGFFPGLMIFLTVLALNNLATTAHSKR